MTGVDRTLRRDVPPPIDVAGHLRALQRALLPALLIALIVGGAVFGLRSALAPKQYAATLVARVIPGGQVMPGDVFVEQLRGPFIALTKDETVLNQVLSSVDTGWDAPTLAAHIATAPGTAPNLLYVRTTADSPKLARDVAHSLVVTVAQAAVANHNRESTAITDQLKGAIAAQEAHYNALAAEDPEKAKSNAQLTDLRAQLAAAEVNGADRLTIMAEPENSTAPVTPKPVSEAVLAAVVTLILASAAIVLLRSRIGSKINEPWAQRIARRYGAVFGQVSGAEAGLPPLAAAALAYQVDAGRTALVLVGQGAAVDVSLLPAGTPTSPGVITAGTATGWWQEADLANVGIGIVAVKHGSADRSATATALDQLRDLDLPSYLVVQGPMQSGRRRSGRGRAQ